MLGMVRISKEADAVGVEGIRRWRAGCQGTQGMQATVQNLDLSCENPTRSPGISLCFWVGICLPTVLPVPY